MYTRTSTKPSWVIQGAASISTNCLSFITHHPLQLFFAEFTILMVLSTYLFERAEHLVKLEFIHLFQTKVFVHQSITRLWTEMFTCPIRRVHKVCCDQINVVCHIPTLHYLLFQIKDLIVHDHSFKMVTANKTPETVFSMINARSRQMIDTHVQRTIPARPNIKSYIR